MIFTIIFFTFAHLSSDRSEIMAEELSSKTSSPSPEISTEEPLTTQLLVETVLPAEAAEATLNEAPIEEALAEEAAEKSLPEKTPEMVKEIQEGIIRQ